MLIRIAALAFASLAEPEAVDAGFAEEVLSPLDAGTTDLGGLGDVDLDTLLGRQLSDKLGTTAAVSKSDESVLRAPLPISSIDAQDIRLSGATNIPDLLRFVPGVQVSQVAPGSFLVSMRGAAGIVGNNIVVALDGVPLNNTIDGTVDWASLPVAIDDLDRVEVVRGPVSSTHGSNAYTGVVNMVSKRGFSRGAEFGARVRGGVDLSGKPIVQAGARYINDNAVLPHAAIISGDFDRTFSSAEVPGAPAQPQALRGSVYLRAGYNLTPSQFVGADFYTAWGQRSSLEHFVLESKPETRGTFGTGLKWEGRDFLGWKDTWRISARYVGQVARAAAADFASFSYAGTGAHRVNLGFDVSAQPCRWAKFMVGFESVFDFVRAPYLSVATQPFNRIGPAGRVALSVFPFSWLDIDAALRVERPAVSGLMAYSLRFALVAHGDNFSVRLATANSYRDLTYIESVGALVDASTGDTVLTGDGSQSTPQNQVLELGATFSPLPRLTLSPTAYWSSFVQVVAESFDPLGRGTYGRGSAQFLLGGELDARWVLTDSVTLQGTFAGLFFFPPRPGLQPQVGVREQNSTIIASLSGRGVAFADRLGYGLGLAVATGRSFSVTTGIPPILIDKALAPGLTFTGFIEYQFFDRVPVWTNLRIQSNPLGVVETVLPSAGRVTSRAMLGFEWRGD